MEKYLKKQFSLISFLFIPIVYYWNPHWMGFLGVQPYWPLFWLLPWSIIHGSIDGLIVGLCLGLILDSISIESIVSHIPGLVFCGIWFGMLSLPSNVVVCKFKYGLICSIASLVCGLIFFSQILINNFPENSIYLYFPSIKNIFAQVFVTGLFAPLLCPILLRLFERSKERDKLISFKNK